MIPRIIHQLWIKPKENYNIPIKIVENCNILQKLNKTYIYKLWDIESIILLLKIKNMCRIADAISICRIPAMQSDLCRLVLLYEYGGLWVDLKLRLNTPINSSWLRYDTLLSQHPDDGGNYPDDHLTNAFMGSIVNSKFIKCLIFIAVKNIEERKPGSIFNLTGANVIRNFLRSDGSGFINDVFIIDKNVVWGEFFSNFGDDYNSDGMHWSIRQYKEPIYRDTQEINYKI